LCGSKTGNGHGKVHVAWIDLVTAEKFEEIFPSNQTVQVFVWIERFGGFGSDKVYCN